MGSISGPVLVECKICGYLYMWTWNDQPFPVEKVIATCGDCMQRVSHPVMDEQYIPFKKIGSIVFTKDGYILTVILTKEVKIVDRE